METEDVVDNAWTATGGRVNFDLHAHNGGELVDYGRGAGQTSGQGSIEAPFAGDHDYDPAGG